MRVPNISIYDTSSYQLNVLTNNLSHANEQISTQKRINSISDDPIGLSQVLDLKFTVNNLTQLEKNIDMGITWLSGSETALRSVSDQMIDAKLLATQLANATVSASERSDAVETINGIIDQVLSLSNTQVNGSYIFSGTKTDIKSFSYDSLADPTKVDYNGNNTAFSIKTAETAKLEVGRDGDEVFTEDKIIVDSTNNKIVFREDPGLGENSKTVLEGTIPDGEYTPEELAIVVRNAMNRASEESGYSVTYDVSYDTDTEKFSFADDGRYDGYMGFDLLWESGELPRIGEVSTNGILKEGVDIEIVKDSALIYQTPSPDGTAPIRLTWDGTSKWQVLNDPGYGLPLEIAGTERKVELDMDDDGLSDIIISMEAAANNGGYVEFDIASESEEHSIGPDLGFKTGDVAVGPPVSSSEVALKTFDFTNNVIDFAERVGAVTSTLSAAIPAGEYYDMDVLAQTIEAAMESSSVNSVDYNVLYDQSTKMFTIKDDGSTLTELQLLWGTGTNISMTAATELGYDTGGGAADNDTGGVSYSSDNTLTLFTITTGTNDAINFKEVVPGSSINSTSELTAQIPAGNYTSPEALARAIEDAMEDESALKGNRVDYEVTYSYISHKFAIKEDGDSGGRKLESFKMLWGTGTDVDTSAASTLGFDAVDIASEPAVSEEVRWGLFETLFDLRDYLSKDDVDGISRTMTRLDTHYNSITSVLSDIGIKYNRLEIRKQVSTESKLTITERKSMIEDVDVVESIMNLQAIQMAYQASLSSTSKIINLSLVDYL